MSVSQHWEKEKYEKNARFVSDYGKELIEWLNPKKDEYILDLGCGDGVLTKEISKYGCKVLGLDGSQKFVEATRKLGVDAIQGDAQNMNFENENKTSETTENFVTKKIKRRPVDLLFFIYSALVVDQLLSIIGKIVFKVSPSPSSET